MRPEVVEAHSAVAKIIERWRLGRILAQYVTGQSLVTHVAADQQQYVGWLVGDIIGAEGARKIHYNRELAESNDPGARRAETTTEFRDKLANPYVAPARGYIDEVIEPRRTRAKLITALRSLETKRDKNPPKKHGNIPL